MKIIEQLTWQKDGLIPVIIQDYRTKKVLMLAYMNKEALQKTLETKETWFYSRSRQKLWHKGATSGHRQVVKQISYDCDSDALLIMVDPKGPACHTGEVSCFFNEIFQTKVVTKSILQQLSERIAKRKKNPVKNSYTAYLFNKGIDEILKKIGEEAGEMIIAAKNDDDDELIWEIADFIYHTLVLMELKEITIEQIYKELARRFNKEVGAET